MKTLIRGMLVAVAATFLTHCTGQETNTQTDQNTVTGARSATEWTLVIARATTDMHKIRPSALLGAYVSEYLLHMSVFQSAIAGVEAQMLLLFDEEFEKEESFVLLEKLGLLLQVDIMDMLNRAASRPKAFDTYMAELDETGSRSEDHLARLEQELDEIRDERRLKRREVSQIQSALNKAIREQDYSSASGLQRQLIDAETELARIDSIEDERRSVIRLYERLLDVAEERIVAMRKNRAPLIAGVKVIEVPGIDDLGLIEEGMRRRGRESPFGESEIDLVL